MPLPEFQAIVLAGGAGQRMQPLTPTLNKSTLPIANRPMVAYPLEALKEAGFSRVIVVTSDQGYSPILNYLQKSKLFKYTGSQEMESTLRAPTSSLGTKMAVDVIACKEKEDGDMMGSLDGLRAASSLIQTENFIVVSADLLMDVSLQPIHFVADVHRIHGAVCTMLLTRYEEKKMDKGLLDYIVMDNRTNKVLHMEGIPDVEDDQIVLPRSLLLDHPRSRVHKDLADLHFYIFNRRVLDIVAERRDMISIKGDLIPTLFQLQSQQHEAESSDRSEVIEFQLNVEPASEHDFDIFAYVIDDPGRAVRVNTMPMFVDVNNGICRAKLSVFYASQTDNVHPKTTLSKSTSIGRGVFVSEGTHFGDSTVVKFSSVGRHCSVGSNVRIVDCVVMDNVSIADGSSLENCVIGNGATVRGGCKLKNCQIAPEYSVKEGTKESGEVFASSSLDIGSPEDSDDDDDADDDQDAR